MDEIVKNIWFITPVYLLIRFMVNIFLNKWLLLDKKREVIISIISIGISYIVYKKFIILKNNLLPDPANLTGELWIIIILYLYSTFNNIDVGTSGSEKRRDIYYSKYYNMFKEQYHDIISSSNPSPILESLIYSVLMYENFNRPPLIRFFERKVFPRYSKTLGIMQVKTKKNINDRESVVLGSNKIIRSYNKQLPISIEKEKESIENPENHKSLIGINLRASYGVIIEALKDYNKDDNYIQGVMELQEILVKKFYPNVDIIW
ncbi:hypothetical protein [Hymenobacter sp. UYP22]|uniref:hypothetical protein n=1 Tax=Hymenobacter sp. UYP22 TaxID=3156348 RepID=UPI003393EE05